LRSLQKQREFDGTTAPNPANLIKFRGILANLYRAAAVYLDFKFGQGSPQNLMAFESAFCRGLVRLRLCNADSLRLLTFGYRLEG